MSEYRIGIKLDEDPFAVEESNYSTKIVSIYIVYELHARSKIPLRNFALRNCLFRMTNKVKNNNKRKYVYSGYKISVDGKGE